MTDPKEKDLGPNEIAIVYYTGPTVTWEPFPQAAFSLAEARAICTRLRRKHKHGPFDAVITRYREVK